MTYANERNIETTKRMFYSRAVDFKNFTNITEEDKKRILELVELKRKGLKNNYSDQFGLGSTTYREGLVYVTSPGVFKLLKNFDEKMFFFINLVDPDLASYYTYVTTEILSKKDLKEITDEKDLEKAIELRRQQVAFLEDAIRGKIGFYDPELLKYEDLYRKAFIRENYFLEDVKISQVPFLLSFMNQIHSFDRISAERYECLNEKVQMWLSLVSDSKDANSLAYNIIKQNHLLKLRNAEECLVFFIVAIDPELKALRIYEEESKREKMEERMIAELGFFDMNLVKAEIAYHKKFTPEMKVSEWTETV